MFSGIGFDEIFFIGILAALFLDIKQVAKVMKWIRTTRGKLANWQYDLEEKMDEYIRPASETPLTVSPPKHLQNQSTADTLRKSHKKQLQHLSLEEKTSQSDQLTAELLKFIPLTSAQAVLFFNPLPDEPQIHFLIQKFLEDQKTLYFPKVEGDSLTIHAIQSKEDFVIGEFGILEPNTLAIENPSIDIALIPGIVFSKNCQRIGRGKGYYDRYLQDVQENIIKCGICFENQVVDDYIPQDLHDISMDVVLTSKQTIIHPQGKLA
jgi:5-formyltetrahydrofolate cyclo-ligase